MKKVVIVALLLCIGIGSAYAGFGDALKKKVGDVKGETGTSASNEPNVKTMNECQSLWFKTDKWVKAQPDPDKVSRDALVKYYKANYPICGISGDAKQQDIKCGKLFSGGGETWCSVTDTTCYPGKGNYCAYTHANCLSEKADNCPGNYKTSKASGKWKDL